MAKETCRSCKFSCRWCISKVNPKNYSFYCDKFDSFYEDDESCACYQLDSRFKE